MLTGIIGRDVAALDPDAFFAELSLAAETDAGSRAAVPAAQSVS
jgi:hypothetical protein